MGSIAMALAVLLGAFASHGLEGKLSKDMLSIFETGVRYHFYHAIGLLVIGIITHWLPSSSLLQWSGGLFASGILIFSGSLYLLALTNTSWLGAITPIGGVCFIAGWVLLAIASWSGL